MAKLIVVSNRLPWKVRRSKEGEFRLEETVGGLATGLKSLVSHRDIVWIGWPGIAKENLKKDDRAKVDSGLEGLGLRPVYLSRKALAGYYSGFCNRTIWPLFHYFTQYASYDPDGWKTYREVNRQFFDVLKGIYEPEDTIWVHDYHLMLLPEMVREEFSKPKVGFFLHIPFPSYEVYRLFPWREEVLRGMLGSDLIGFHTYDYVTHFLNSARRVLGLEHRLGSLLFDGHGCKVDAYPMGIDYERFSSGMETNKVKRKMARIREKVGNRKIILSIDRMDYTKGIPNRLEAYEMFLDQHPEYREQVTFILVAVPSREKVDHYEILKRNIDEKVGKIEGKFGTIGWAPVWYIYRFLPFDDLLALYGAADVCMVTPLRDGMNLMAKEYIASRKDGKGVLVLSEMAGSAHELSEALMVNPNDLRSVVRAIARALVMNENEMVRRNRSMQERIRRYDIMKWGRTYMEDLVSISDETVQRMPVKLVSARRMEVLRDFLEKKERLMLLDYDGTLADIAEMPMDAAPDKDLIDLLVGLSKVGSNTIYLISGRDRDNVEEWFGQLRIGLMAEHGLWIRHPGDEWQRTEILSTDWKMPIKSLLNIYTDRTPGSFMEEKDGSFVWHFRKTNPDIGSVRSKELVGDLLDLTSNTDLRVMEGNKIVEIRKVNVNKGNAVSRLLSDRRFDFIMAIGDDTTDEDVFTALPSDAYSIKVGMAPTNARFKVDSTRDVRSLLKDLMRGR